MDPGPICASLSSYTFTAAPSGGTWSGPVVTPGGDVFPSTIGPGIYAVNYSYTNSFGCESNEDLFFEVIAAPFAFPSNDGPYCENDQINLYGNTNGTGSIIDYIWSGPNNYSSSEQNPSNATEPGLYLLQVIVDGCPSSFEVTEVFVTPEPEAIPANDGPYCDGSQINLFGTTPGNGNNASYEWSGPNNYFSFDQNPIDATEPGIYTLIVTIDNCPSQPVQTEVEFLPAPDALAANDGPYCAGDAISLNGETTTSGTTINYSWSGPNNYTSNDQNPLDATEPGTYFLTIEVDGCNSDTVETVVVLNALPEPTISGSSTFCVNSSSILDAGVYASYVWQDNSNDQTYEVTVEGTYSVTVTDDNGCTGEDQVFVQQTQSLNPVIVGDLEICDGENAVLDAGLGFDNYLWSNNDTTQTIQVNSAEDYSVTVTDATGCTGETTATLVINNNPTLTISGDESFCDGESSVLNGGVYSNYLWSDSTTNQTLEVFDSGIYTLQITDANGCTAEDDITITENDNPAPSITGPSSFCTGNSTTLDAGPGYDTYLWSNNNEDTQTIEVTSGGLIGLTVTDSNGCTGETSLDVTENAQLTPVIVGDVDFCEGETSILDAGSGYATYEWSNGDTTQTIEVSESNNYGVFVTDASGCSGSDNVNITEFNNPEPTIGGSTTYCVGGFTILDAGAGYDNYVWSNNDTTQSITVSSPGNYTVEVVDQNGCIGTAAVDVEESTSLNPVISGEVAFCENDFTILDAGTGFDTYLWSDNSNGQTLQVDAAGNYSITVSDAQGCTGETTVSVDEILPPTATLTTDTSLCNTEAGGSHLNLYDLIQSGDTNGTWEDVDNSGAVGLFNDLNFNTIAAGVYTFVYTTNSAVAPCPEASYQVSITVIDCSCPDVTFFVADPLCNGGEILDLNTIENTTEEGIWSISQTPNGTNPATISGSDFDPTDADIGEYILNYELITQPPPGCSNTFTTSVFVEDVVEAGTADLPLAFCYEEDNSVTLSNLIIGGEAGGAWTETSANPSQNNAFDPVIGTFTTNGQDVGTYTFQYLVSSTGACPDDFEEVTVVINGLPVANAGNPVELNCYNPTQILDGSLSDSGNDFDVLWSGSGIIGIADTTEVICGEPGPYTLTITNNITGCSASDMVQVSENFTIPQIDAGNDNTLTCDETSVALEAQGDIGAGFEILWEGPGINPGNQNDPNPVVNEAGIYSLTTTDLENGCTSAADEVEVFNDADIPDIFVQTPLEELTCEVLSLDLTGGSVNDASFQWYFENSLVGTDEILSDVSTPGIYTFVVTDNITGCSTEESIEVFENVDYPVADAGNPQLLNCYETEVPLDGSNSDSGQDIIYQWSGPAGGISGPLTEASSNAILPGTYSLTVINQLNGCSSSANVVVDQDITPPNVVIDNPDQLDCTITEVTIDGSSSSTGSNFTYAWTDASTNLLSTEQTVTVENAGTYNLTILNITNGCTATSSTLVEQNADIPYATIMDVINPSCFGDTDGFIAINQVLGGSSPYVYSINSSEYSSTNVFNSLSPGMYDIALEDANGCSWDTTVVIVEPVEVNIELGPDIEIEFGETGNIEAFVNIPPNRIDTIIWSPEDLIVCSDQLCVEGSVFTYNTTLISATVFDINGCSDSDDIMLRVKKDRRVYIPTAFSPNGDGDNDTFYIYVDADQVKQINHFAIYSRWGEQVFEASGFEPNDPMSGWDGNFKDQRMNPAVFVYFAEIEFIDGHVEMYKGDVTLMK